MDQVGRKTCFRILIATDNHLGYAEKDPVRGQDAMNTFREILTLARDQDVDFILLAGDLFHENRPSRTCLHQTIALLRQFTFGDKPVSFELLSDPMDGAAPGYDFPAVNYEDSNLNVGIPVFSIHGNHDDPQGTGPEGALCALDVLSVAGVLNYFGKVDLPSGQNNQSNTENDTVNIRPVLLRKGSTHLGLYGVGNIKDIRFHYQLRSNGVKMFMPRDGDGGIAAEDWFNLLLIHQNRVKHGPQQAVPEGMFDDSIKLVLWGHEHDCRIWPEQVEGKPYFISQPGSSVATSLAHGEALPKHVGILSIQGDKFQIAEVPLKTVRPFEIDDLELGEEAERDGNKIKLDDKDTISAYLREKVEELIAKARRAWKETHDEETEEMMLPLIRLRVETTGAKEMTNPVRFGQDFIGRVANPRDILQYYRRKVATRNPAAMTTTDRLAKIRMAKLVKQYLQAQNLDLLVEDGLEEAVMRFVDKDDKDAIKE
ncbi:DNA repair exonuclease [Cutaneotrichosporon oleaginosum]|uniref:DNA repair exonuclease n=2 Tax=Cutaneotrichosporon oleaginosum TaxID=879819 RepID=A0A0J0XGN2_9TREE|nr:DNA repair exonuclease [Cutaneotrichosporon oleaginosum]KLT40250.1 DNA repair exonuclease [Cutaneotrichosporon oleaginosum]